MKGLRIVAHVLMAVVLAGLLIGCRVTNNEVIMRDVPEAIKEQMMQDRDEGGAFVYRPEDHDIDGYYLLFSQGLGENPGPIGPVPQLDVIMDKYRYNSQTKTLTVTIHQYTYEHGKVPSAVRRRDATSSDMWYIILRFKGRPIENVEIVTSEGVEIPVLTK